MYSLRCFLKPRTALPLSPGLSHAPKHFANLHSTALQNKYKTSEEGRRVLEIMNIKMAAENCELKNRVQGLKHQVLSHKWQMHSGVEEHRREEDGRFVGQLQAALETEMQAREDAERKVEHLERVGRELGKKTHLFKEPLYRAKLLEKDLQRSWGRVAPSESKLNLSRSPDIRGDRSDRHRPMSAPGSGARGGGRQRALQAKKDALNLIHSYVPTERNLAAHSSRWKQQTVASAPSSPVPAYSPPMSESKVRYGSPASSTYVLPRVYARYYDDPAAPSGDDDATFDAALEDDAASRSRKSAQNSPGLSISAVSSLSSPGEAHGGQRRGEEANEIGGGISRMLQAPTALTEGQRMCLGFPQIAEEQCSDSD